MSENSNGKNKSLSVPLPSTPDGWVLKSGLKRTINDEIQVIHERIINDPTLAQEYHDALEPVSDEESKEGWLAFEDVSAVQMIRDYAKANGHSRVMGLRGAAIRSSLNVVLRRYGMARNQRRYMVDGATVPPPNAE
jgi:hypothetical protein